jgi:hypothetical protein
MTTAPFHVAGMKCSACGSYNTSVEGPLQKLVQITGRLILLIFLKIKISLAVRGFFLDELQIITVKKLIDNKK